MAEMKRLTAIKTNIEEVVKGKFHPAEGFTPGYIISPNGAKLSRVRLMANVMGKFISDDGNYGSLTLDDESETVRVKVFKDTKMLDDVEVGDLVDVFGKVREYNEEIYVSPEIIKKIDDPNFLILRMAELSTLKDNASQTREKIEEIKKQTSDLDEAKKLAKVEGIDEDTVEAAVEEEESSDKKNAKDTVLETIDSLDDGTGAEYGDIIKKCGLEEELVDEVINDLLSEGSCYEPRPGRIKKL